jgi:hypothetical protein
VWTKVKDNLKWLLIIAAIALTVYLCYDGFRFENRIFLQYDDISGTYYEAIKPPEVDQ